MKPNSGFTLIEVLVASVILFLSILTLNAAYKQYARYRAQQAKYERIYMAALSLADLIKAYPVSKFAGRDITLDSVKFHIKTKLVAAKRGYVLGVTPKATGNKGQYMIKLYKISISTAHRKFTLYKTEYEKSQTR